jgi:hypothetical protein
LSTIDLRDLLREPEKYLGALVQVEGRIQSGQDMRALIHRDLMHSIPATWEPTLEPRGCVLDTTVQGVLQRRIGNSPRHPEFVFHVHAVRPVKTNPIEPERPRTPDK